MALFGRRNVLLAMLLVAAAAPSFLNAYYVFVANTILIYVLLAIGLNILVGNTGQLAFANAAMFGIGAYGTGLLQSPFPAWPFWLAFPSGAVIATAVGLAISLPALRLSGLYLALSTLAFAQFTQWVFLNWEAVTFGAGGFKTPTISFAPLPVSKTMGLYYLSLILVIVLFVLAQNLVRSRIGRAFVAVRDSEIAAQSLGVDLLRYKALAFGISGFYAGIAGGLYSAMLNFVSPEGYDLFQMVIQKAMIVVGGLGSIAGSVLGASALVSILEILRKVKGFQEIVFGAILVGFILVCRAASSASSRQRCAAGKNRCTAPGPANVQRSPRPPRRAARSGR